LAVCPGVHLRVIALLQCALSLGIPEIRQQLLDCVNSGLVGCMPLEEIGMLQDSTRGVLFWEREAAFWQLLGGVTLVFLGDVLSRYRRSTGQEMPVIFAMFWVLLFALSATMRPRSVFWLGLAHALWMLFLSCTADGSGSKVRAGDEHCVSSGGRPESEFHLLEPHGTRMRADGSRQSPKSILCIVVITAGYAFLVPGLVTISFSAKAWIVTTQILDIEKSTVGLVSMLIDQGSWLPAILILLYSVLMPFAKLSVLLLYAHHAWKGSPPSGIFVSAGGVRAVQLISKWATVDTFLMATICGIFCQPHMFLEIELHDGFYYFMAYCVLSVGGALLIELPAEPQAEEGASMSCASVVKACLVSAAVFALLGYLIFLPVLRAELGIIGLYTELSIALLVSSLWDKGFGTASLFLAVLVVVLPALDFISAVVSGLGLAPNRAARKWLPDLAMLDVFAVATFVVVSAVAALHNSLVFTMLPAGWLLLALSVPWVLFTWTAPCMEPAGRAEPASQQPQEEGVGDSDSGESVVS